MNICLVRIVHTYCCRLSQRVKMYVKWYMMWYLKKDMFCKEHIFSADASFLKRSVCCPFFGWSGHRPYPVDTFHVQLDCAFVRSCIRMSIFTILCAIVLAITCLIVRTIFSVGPGFKPLAFHTIFLVGRGFNSLTLQHDLFVSPGFNSRNGSPVSGP